MPTPPNPLAKLGPLTKKHVAGFAFMYLAGLGWLTDIIVPFTHLPNKALIFTIALCVAEASFLIGIGLLGRAYYKQAKELITRMLTNRRSKP